MRKGYIFILDIIIAISIALIITETVIQNQSMSDELRINDMQLQNIGEDLLKALDKKGDLDTPDEDELVGILEENLPSNIGYRLNISIYTCGSCAAPITFNNEGNDFFIESGLPSNEYVSSQRLLVINAGEKFGNATIKLWLK